MKKAIEEFKSGSAIIKIDNWDIRLGKEFKRVYKEKCISEGANPFMDFEIFKHSPNSSKDTVLYRLLKEMNNRCR